MSGDEYQSRHGSFDPDEIGRIVAKMDVKSQRPRWEYKLIGAWDLTEKQLNWLGEQGWRAVCFVPGRNSNLLMIRERIDEPEV